MSKSKSKGQKGPPPQARAAGQKTASDARAATLILPPELEGKVEALRSKNDYKGLAALLEPQVRAGSKDPAVLYNFAWAIARQNRLSDAIAVLQRTISLAPTDGRAWLELCEVARVANQPELAIQAGERARDHLTDHPFVAQLALGRAYQKKGEFEKAVGCFDLVLKETPEDLRTILSRGQCLQQLKRLEEAEEAARAALKLKPESKEAHVQLAQAVMALQKVDVGLEVCRKAVELFPNDGDTATNLGVASKEAGLIEEALKWHGEAVQLSPNSPAPKWNQSHVRLLVGDYDLGWELYESRWGTADFKDTLRPFKEPTWQGEALGNKILLVHLEQGVGDMIQFGRYLPMIMEANPAAEVLLETQASVHPILEYSFRKYPRLLCLPHLSISAVNLPPFDWQVHLGALPRIFRTRVETIPYGEPYLEVPKKRDYRQPGDDWVIGISWASKGATGRKRSLTLERMVKALSKPGVRLVDLQYGDTSEERKQVKKNTGVTVVHDDTVDALQDMLAFGEQVAGCDLVISIDNTTVHTAGALGVPCWTILPYIPDFRWLLRREDSPWYHSIRLFRAPKMHDYETPLGWIEEALEKLIAGDRSQLEPVRWEGPPAREPGTPTIGGKPVAAPA